MNCFETRRLALADPLNGQAGFLEHLRRCRSCAIFANDARRAEARLAGALKLPVPEGLRERIVLRRSIAGNRIRKRRYALALAAGFVLAVALGVGQPRPEDNLREAVTDFVRMRPVRNDVVDARLPRDAVNSVLHEVGVVINRDIGAIAFAEPCDIHEGRGAHLVVPGQRGPVIVLILPHAEVRRQVALRMGDRIGMIMPCPRGSIAIVGAKDEPLDAIHRRLEGAISWI